MYFVSLRELYSNLQNQSPSGNKSTKSFVIRFLISSLLTKCNCWAESFLISLVYTSINQNNIFHCRKDQVINIRTKSNYYLAFLLIQIIYSKIHKSQKVLLLNRWANSFMILCIYTRINHGNVFFIAGRIQAFTHLIIQHNQINWLQELRNNVQDSSPGKTDFSVMCDIFKLLRKKVRAFVDLQESSSNLQMY